MNIYIITFVCLLLQGIRGIPDFLHLKSLLKRINSSTNKSLKKMNKKIFILIPVYKEQNIIKETISYYLNSFKNKNIYIVFITSSKEKGNLSTLNIINEELRKKEWSNEINRVLIFTENNENSTMATQLNFAVKKIIDLDKNNDENLFMLYNADSRPSPYSTDLFYNTVSIKLNSDFALQQPCAFVKDVGRGINSFVDGLSMYQTWFCMGQENRIIKNYEKKVEKDNNKKGVWNNLFYSQLGYCVGHGSSMKIGTHIKEGGYPENFLTEDLTFGYFLSAHKIPIYLVDVLEVADVPLNFKTFVKQRSVWFWNYIEYISCFFDKRVSEVPIEYKLGLLFKGLTRGAYWLFSSFFYALPILIGILKFNLLILFFGILGIFMFQIVPVFYLIKNLPKCLTTNGLQQYSKQMKNISKPKIALSIILITLTDSIGPWIGTLKALWYLPQRKRPTKYKTER